MSAALKQDTETLHHSPKAVKKLSKLAQSNAADIEEPKNCDATQIALGHALLETTPSKDPAISIKEESERYISCGFIRLLTAIVKEEKNSWTRTHSHFALMGGFTVDTSEMSIELLKSDQVHAEPRLLGRSLLYLLNCAARSKLGKRFLAEQNIAVPSPDLWDLTTLRLLAKRLLAESGRKLPPSLKDFSDKALNFLLPDISGRATLSPLGLRFLAENVPEALPEISRRAIRDKSKASSFTKLVACLQVLWFCLQVVGRLAAGGSPISFLELNTFLHAICCVCTYLAWWQKPLDITEPEKILTPSDTCLGLYARHCLHKELYLKTVTSLDESDRKIYTASLSRQDPQYLSKDCRRTQGPDQHTYAFDGNDITDRVREIDPLDKPLSKIRIYHQQSCFGYRLRISPDPKESSKRVYATLKWADVKCLELADYEMTHNTPARGTKKIWHHENKLNLLIEQAPMMYDQNTVVVQPEAIPSTEDPHGQSNLTWQTRFPLLSYIIVGAFYGGLHLLAWNGPFLTLREQWMWRISCIVIASPLLVFPLGIFVVYTWSLFTNTTTRKHDHSGLTKCTRKVALLIFWILIIAYVLVYIAARFYLLVECFINLVHLPAEVYNEPDWSRYFPHLSIG